MLNMYFSIPISMDWNGITSVISSLPGITTSYWNRKEWYDPMLLNTSDGVVFVLPGFIWSCNINALPIGLRKELSTALVLNKKIYILYKSTSGTFGIYEAAVDTKTIEGRKGTNGSYLGSPVNNVKYVPDLEEDNLTEEELDGCYTICDTSLGCIQKYIGFSSSGSYDIRLLLLI